MDERQIHLKIKVKSLAAEAQINRQEAKKTSGEVRWRLNDHRKGVLRRHARNNLLAYGVLRGVPYSVIERTCRHKPDISAVTAIARRFGGDETAIQAWVQEAKEYMKERRREAA